MSSVTKGLHKNLADSYALYLKTHNYHWNVEGPHFKALHELFEEHYNALALAVDEVAERIRMRGEKVAASFKRFDTDTEIKDGNENLDWRKMVSELAADHEKMSKNAHALIEKCQDAGDEVTADMLVARAAEHDKAAWMLKMHLA
ncbi:UNVERIFIED_CONTAM: hypothetical protein GTU68_014775 [Idotea baltica]|nr:hypothetical protein [Idotea baltica]